MRLAGTRHIVVGITQGWRPCQVQACPHCGPKAAAVGLKAAAATKMAAVVRVSVHSSVPQCRSLTWLWLRYCPPCNMPNITPRASEDSQGGNTTDHVNRKLQIRPGLESTPRQVMLCTQTQTIINGLTCVLHGMHDCTREQRRNRNLPAQRCARQ